MAVRSARGILCIAMVLLVVGEACAWEVRAPRAGQADQILVHLTADAARARQTYIQRIEAAGARVSVHPRREGWLSVSVPRGLSAHDFAARLRGIPGIDGADPHLRCFALQTPNDPFYRPEDDPDPETGYEQYYLFDTNAGDAWETTHGSSDTVIAVIDSGLSFFHEDIDGLVWQNAGEVPGDGIDNDGNGYIDDVHGWDFVGSNIGDPANDLVTAEDSNPNVWDPAWWDDSWGQPPPDDTWWDDPVWLERLDTIDPAIGNTANDDNDPSNMADNGVNHGTNVAGMIGTVTNNGVAMAGMAWGCSLMPVRVINAEGWGWGLDAADAIRYAAENGADIINMSFSFGLVDLETPPQPGEEGYADYLEALEVRDAIVYATERGSIVVAAAGNSGDQYVGLDFPASMPETISVGSVDWDGNHSYYSAVAGDNDVLDIVAPGEWTLTTGLMEMYSWATWRSWGLDVYLGQDTYTQVQGTSFSAPLVSGFAGLYRTAYPDASYLDLRAALHATGQDLGDPGYDSLYGWGLLDAGAAIDYYEPWQEPIPEPATTALFVVGIAGLAWKLRRRP